MFVSHLAPRGAGPLNRDLASFDLWEKSLERSQRRRELAERQRRQAPKTKGTAAVMSVALFASPMLPGVTAAGAQNGAGAAEEPVDPGRGGRGAVPTLLREGDLGPMVAAVQRRLAIDDDGIFGPITRQAILDFQARYGIPRSGEVDARTWRALFRASVSYVAADSAIAERIVRDERRPKAPKLRVVPRERAVETQRESAPVTAPAPAPAPAPVAVDAPDREKAPEVADEPVAVVRPPKETVRSPAAGCGTMASPVQGTVTGSFGEDRGDHSHAGQDIAAPTGTPVRAVDCGTVTRAASESGYGNIVCIQHSGSLSTCYAHLSSFDTSQGDYVEVGQVIGRVGTTGNSTGPHLHFEVRENGRAVDPRPYLSGAAAASDGSRAEQSSGASNRVTVAATDDPVVGQGGATRSGVAAEAGTQRAGLAAQPVVAAKAAPAAAPAAAAEASASASAPAPAPVAEAAPAPVAEAAPAPVAEAAPAPVAEAAPAPAAEAAPAPAPPPAAEAPSPVPVPAAEAPSPAPAPAAEAPSAPAPVAEAAPAAPPAPAAAEAAPAAEAPPAPAPAPVPAVEAPPAAPVAEAPPAPVADTPPPPAPAPAEAAPAAEAPAVGAPAAPAG